MGRAPRSQFHQRLVEVPYPIAPQRRRSAQGLEDWKTKRVRHGRSALRARAQDHFRYDAAIAAHHLQCRNLETGIRPLKVVAWNQALIPDMIFAQPVVYELDRISVATLLVIGFKDRTAIAKDRAPSNLAETLGNYPRARQARDRIRRAELVLR